MSECKRERERERKKERKGEKEREKESERLIHKKRGWSRDEKRVHVVENKCE